MTATIITTILQYALTSIIALEQAFPQAGLGTTKKQILMSGVTTVIKATAIETGLLAASGSNTKTNQTISAITQAASEFTDATVAILKNAKAGPFGASEEQPANVTNG